MHCFLKHFIRASSILSLSVAFLYYGIVESIVLFQSSGLRFNLYDHSYFLVLSSLIAAISFEKYKGSIEAGYLVKVLYALGVILPVLFISTTLSAFYLHLAYSPLINRQIILIFGLIIGIGLAISIFVVNRDKFNNALGIVGYFGGIGCSLSYILAFIQ